jgi:adenylate kinase family enzyme
VSEEKPNAMDSIHRVSVVGATGSGKTTFAAHLAHVLAVPHVELDSLHWERNWVEAPLEIFRARVERALTGDRWVVDGNYSKARDIVWSRADTVIWLDYSLPRIFWRLTGRTLKRVLTHQVLWNENRETWNQFSKDSLFLWVLTSRPRHHRDYPRLFQEYSHLRVFRLYSPREADKWLNAIQSATHL